MKISRRFVFWFDKKMLLTEAMDRLLVFPR